MPSRGQFLPLSRLASVSLVLAACVWLAGIGRAAAPATPFPLDRAGERWVGETLARLTLEQKVGQLIVPAIDSAFVSTDSDLFDGLARLVREYHVGGFHVFGAKEAVPAVLLDPHYGINILGQPLEAASLLNRLQAMSDVPLLNTSDFEAGVGFRLAGATRFPREMALGAAGDPDLAREAARITALEARAIGVQVNFSPLADVNNNARNPVINTRSFGEDPERVAALVTASIAGARDGGVVPTLKHFPGHGDTDVDTHLGLATIAVDRNRLDRVELVPFRAGLAAHAGAVMAGHIEVPAIDPRPDTPATLSDRVLGGLLRRDLGFDGLVYTDSMIMDAVVKLAAPGDAAVRAIAAGADEIVQPPDPIAAFQALVAAVRDGRLSQARLNASVERILRAKAFVGLPRARQVALDAVPALVGGRVHQAVASQITARTITLVRDDRHQVPLAIPRTTPILYLSVLDYPAGWQIAAPSRTFIPELKARWPQVTAVELSDHSPAADLEFVRSIAPRYGAVIASVFVRAASGSGRMDLAPELLRLLNDVARTTRAAGAPFVACVFGNPYVAGALTDAPAILLTYDFYDQPELAAVRAIAGEAPITGRLPVTIPGAYPMGTGLIRMPGGSSR